MKVRALIKLLEAHAKKHGDNAQMAVNSTQLDPDWPTSSTCREEIFIHMDGISTVLDSRGEVIVW